MSAVARQFAHPRGLSGRLVGHAMAVKNARRGRWVVGLLEIDPPARVLEIGFGPGCDLARLLSAGGGMTVAGVDASATMPSQARRRNAAAGRAGRADLRQGTADALPWPDASFDAVFTVNSVQFWPDLAAGLREAYRVLRPRGRLAAAIQPRDRDPAAALGWAGRLQAALAEAGFTGVTVDTLPAGPATVVCVRGRRA